MICVIAGNASQFREYCNDMGLKPGIDAIYVVNEITLLGRIEGTFVFVGTFDTRSDLPEIMNRVRVIEAIQK